ncbi:ABC transporter ATP-binding protein [Biformimicrobium ophioploci]|uniref:ABC transporter ATP-binding protein n=1 Tax=Biformimicrobium ophioploci TaxID=3036711 RepID=A0ABQ6LXJ8_9GAMM|nr:ABC transporter ATP-binding protein [Microbulbifer sp. NKW57]GMG86818.1 ABC transporter ATP-binding protein [Microbulbifer sp. NKW57]
MNARAPILTLRNLSKSYDGFEAVKGISLEIPTGICFGLLGPNGAGKTTTIEMIEGVSTPTAGDILYKGDPQRRQLADQAGIQFQSTALMDYLKVNEVLDLFASFYPAPMPRQQLVDLCQLQDILDRSASKLSGGQRQRLLLAVALVNDPELVFLDEPTTGLDPHSRRQFWHLVETIRARGKTVLLTTHYMEEAERLCDDLAIMNQGKIIARGSPQALLDEHFEHVLVCLPQTHFTDNCEALRRELADTLSFSGGQAMITSSSVDRTLQQLIESNISLDGLQVRNPTLDDLFLKLTGLSLEAQESLASEGSTG